jgi:diguanylate cyclase (GGDEF)-like protein
MGEGISGWVAQHGEPVIVSEPGDDPRFASPVRSAICIPLRSRDRTLGVIELLNYRASTLTEETLAFLHVLCDYAAIAIQNVRAVERIQELTITDDCTGLFNSRHLFSITDSELERSRRFNLAFSLIFIDLDHFKRVNDLYGHLTGSRLLAEIAGTIKNNVRGIDSAFRYGGDEFIVLLPQTGKDAALEVTQRLLHALRDTRYLLSEGLELRMMASFGIATYPEDGSSVQQIIGAADKMMYLVKNSARGNIAVAQRGLIQER